MRRSRIDPAASNTIPVAQVNIRTTTSSITTVIDIMSQKAGAIYNLNRSIKTPKPFRLMPPLVIHSIRMPMPRIIRSGLWIRVEEIFGLKAHHILQRIQESLTPILGVLSL
jgi:hypothetical protein